MKEITIKYIDFNESTVLQRNNSGNGKIVQVLIDSEPIEDLEYFKTEFTPDQEPVIIIERRLNHD